MSEEFQDDAALMLALREGDERALKLLVVRWELPLLRFAYRYTQDEQAARDIVQETMIRLFRKCDRYNAEFPLSTWLFTIAANLCKNHARWRRRHPETSWDAPASANDDSLSWQERIASDALTPKDEADRLDRFALLRQMIDQLPHDLKVALLLHYYEGLSCREISLVSDCSIRGVETRLYRARKRLKALWEMAPQ